MDKKASADFTIGIVTALVDPELRIALDTLKERDWKEEPSDDPQRMADILTFKKNGATLFVGSIGTAGQAASGIETLIFMERCFPPPRVVFLCGIAGTLDKKLEKKDVVVGSSVRWKTQDKVEGPGPAYTYRPKVFDTPSMDRDLQRVLNRRVVDLYPAHKSGERGFAVHFSEVFTSDYVVSSHGYVDDIKKSYPEAICCEMEAGGFTSAIERHVKAKYGRAVTPIVVRGISDDARLKDNDSGVRAAACRNATLVSASIATDIVEDPKGQIRNLLTV